MLMKYLLPGSPPSLVLGLVLFTGALAESSSSITQTLNYIDTVSGYDELSTCAEQVLSTVVRGQFSGCGDSNALTSYTCFCTASSSFMSAVISKDVVSSCPASVASVQASSALGVFNEYCELGVSAGLTTQTAQNADTSTSASPAGTIASATATVTTSSTSTSGSSNSSSSTSLSSTTVAILVGVLIPVFAIVVALAAWFFWRKHKRTLEKSRGLPEQVNESNVGPSGWAQKSIEAPTYEHMQGMSAVPRPAEILTTEHPTEVPAYSNPVELPAGSFERGQNTGVGGDRDG